MKIATYNVNSIRRRLPLVLDWLSQNQPDVLCLQETKVQDQEFPAEAFRDVGYHSAFRGMKAYNGVATLTRNKPDRVIHGLHEGPDNEDVRIIQTIVDGIPIINTYVPQGYSITSEKYAFKLAWFDHVRRYFETHLDPASPAIWLGDLNIAPEPIDVYHPDRRATMSTSTSTLAPPTSGQSHGASSMCFESSILSGSSIHTGITSATPLNEISAGASTIFLPPCHSPSAVASPTSISARVGLRAHRTTRSPGPNSTNRETPPPNTPRDPDIHPSAAGNPRSDSQTPGRGLRIRRRV